MNSGYIVFRENIELKFQTSGLAITNIPPEKFKEIVRSGKMVLMTVELPVELALPPLNLVATPTINESEESVAYTLSGYSALTGTLFLLSLGVIEGYLNEVVFQIPIE